MIIIVLGITGAILTLIAGVRFFMLARAGAPRELLLGWLAVIVIIPMVVFAAARVLG
jgi:hypothetical protein